MEVKLTHKKHISPSKSLLSNLTKTTFPPHTLRLKPWAAAEIQHFQGLVKKWRLQNKTKDYSCAHVVKEGETLSSISKMYGVSVHSIAAANKNIVNINLVFQGQLLNIPSSSLLDTQLDRAKKSRLWQSIRALKAPSGQNTLHTRVSRSIKHQAADKSQAHHPGAKGRRWKSALSDSVEGDVFDSELGLDSNSTSEDEANIQNEEAYEDYGRLEHDYQKFLSECGISKWGYWRGGSPGA
ncbi:DNA-directed RNA polymerase subunit beta [Gossypium australe]|uniref:DNA-directed RNA polymerase subunit beta n=1 Tax=Gossypium australe TaxID=47621 RepID=A0A5B6WZT5_9ROSI|nr:DNA-directed RNA polymerase subunit beta [Gossypium australe]